MFLTRDRIFAGAATLFLMVCMVGIASTSLQSRIVIEAVRFLAILGTLALLVLSFIYIPNISRARFTACFAFLFFSVYGLTLSVIFNSIDHVLYVAPRNIVIGLTGIFLLGACIEKDLMPQAIRPYLIVCFAVLGLTVVSGGFTFDFPPRFVLNYNSDSAGQEILYSQGVSKFFGIAALFSVIRMNYETSVSKRNIFLFSAFMFAGLSVIGGGRGDSIIAVLLLAAYLLIRSKRTTLLLGLGVLAVLPFAGDLRLPTMDDFVFFQRILFILDGASVRVALLREAFTLMAEQPLCLVTGCGFGFYQFYTGHPTSLYPHNQFVEFVIVFGLPLFAVMIVLVARGLLFLWRLRTENGDYAVLLALYVFGIGSKSGTLGSDWLFVSMLFATMMFGVGATRSFALKPT